MLHLAAPPVPAEGCKSPHGSVQIGKLDGVEVEAEAVLSAGVEGKLTTETGHGHDTGTGLPPAFHSIEKRSLCLAARGNITSITALLLSHCCSRRFNRSTTHSGCGALYLPSHPLFVALFISPC
jgi:hypothetical protein